MITLTHTVSGQEVGHELADDPESAADALNELASCVDLAELRDQLDNLQRHATAGEVKHLRALAQTILDAMPVK